MGKNIVIGVLGGMGTYATINLFREYAHIFPAEKEWERPRIIIDNNCVMPSRVRAILYNEKVDELVDEMTMSIKGLINAGASHIVLACNTSHLFLEKIYQKVPEARNYIINIIDVCVEEVKQLGITKTYLLATEGTILSEVYLTKLKQANIVCKTPSKEEFFLLRECIEAVKQNKYGDNIKNIFFDLVKREDSCILGCTELPILYDMYKEEIKDVMVFDPLCMALERIKGIYEKID